jgi:hypothetical protein
METYQLRVWKGIKEPEDKKLLWQLRDPDTGETGLYYFIETGWQKINTGDIYIKEDHVITDDTGYFVIRGKMLNVLLRDVDFAIHTLNELIASQEESLYHTNSKWEAASLNALNAYINTTTETAFDTINNRTINNFDVYLALDESKNYYWDSGVWLPLISIPKTPINIIQAWSTDDVTINVRLSNIPEVPTTISSFAVWNARNGMAVTITSITGAGVDYILTIPQQTENYGIRYISQV